MTKMVLIKAQVGTTQFDNITFNKIVLTILSIAVSLYQQTVIISSQILRVTFWSYLE